MDLTKTVFGDLRKQAVEVVRVTTEQSLYFVAFHEERGRKYVVVRGQEGSDREHVVVRDSDPRVGEHSMFDVPVDQWVGQVMEVATMRTSAITHVAVEQIPAGASMRERLKLGVELPKNVDPAPRIVQGLGRGTNIARAEPRPVDLPSPAMLVQPTQEVARQAVIGEQQLPYPQRHVMYAENVAALLRSIHRRDTLFEDIAHDRELKARYLRALDDAEDLLKLVKRRAKK